MKIKKTLLTALLGASLGLFGGKNLSAQSSDSLNIEIETIDKNEIGQRIYAIGYSNGESVAYVLCNSYKNNHYTERKIHWYNKITLREEFKINYDTGLIDYCMSHSNSSQQYKEIVNFKNLTKDQIYQDKEFAERTKKIINACESETNLRELIKEISKEKGIIKIPQIKQ
ncbi:MAG: hypothetical protein AABY06_00120 [Nanoarchaeota archaeon]